MSEWVDIKQCVKAGKVIAKCNDIVSEWEQELTVYICPEYGTIFFENDEGEDFPCIVTHWKECD